ncbi:MAG: hypothetical protein U9N50_14125 [Pseudomonadota bacterium]|nr:hypothetical protein [Pseudomonadota bacterium]
MKLSYRRYRAAPLLLAILVAITPVCLLAQESDVEPANWAFSSVFGTGWYQLDGNQSVFALSLPVRQALQRSSITETGERKIGFEIDYALSVGLYNIDNLTGLIHPDNFASVVFTPGIELEIPITRRWNLRPYLNVGWGAKLGSSDSAWIYYTGIKSRYIFPADSGNWALINSLYYAGYTPNVGSSNDLTAILTGLEYRQQLNRSGKTGDPIDLHWSLAYSYLADGITFQLPGDDFDTIDDQFEVALAYGYRKHPIKLWFMEFDNVGLGYRFSSNGAFKGISLKLGSWFLR